MAKKRAKSRRSRSRRSTRNQSFYQQPWMLWAGLPVIAIAVLALAFFAFNADNDDDDNESASASGAFGITLVDLDNKDFSLSDYEGRPVLVNFWATWCPPCRAEMPELQRYSNAQGEDGPVIILVTSPDQRQGMTDISQFIRERDITMRVGLDMQGDLRRLMTVNTFPSTLFFDEEGNLQHTHTGAITYDELERQVARLN